jgi:hypothetical protein
MRASQHTLCLAVIYVVLGFVTTPLPLCTRLSSPWHVHRLGLTATRLSVHKPLERPARQSRTPPAGPRMGVGFKFVLVQYRCL